MAQLAKTLYLLITTIILPSLYNTATITCPTLSCTVEIDTNVCYLHDNSQPTSTLRGQSCSSDRICEFAPYSGEFAWYTEATQAISSGATSYIQNKEVTGYGDLIAATRRKLNAGRSGGENTDGLSGNCNDDDQCEGLAVGEYCSLDSDCDKNLFCQTSTTWPFRAQCATLLGSLVACTADTQGQARYFCWYASNTDQAAGSKKCLDKFTKADGSEFGWGSAPSDSLLSAQEYNGQYCKSGFAVQNSSDSTMAICKTVTSITYNGNTLTSPYECTPTDTSINGRLVYGTGGTDYVETSCKGALYGSTGYGGSIAGTSEYQKYTAAMKIVYENTTCHTLDRNNYRALKESGGIGSDNDHWRYAIQKRFNATYWPYIQHDTTRNGLEAMFADSYTNLRKNSAYFTIEICGILVVSVYALSLNLI